MTIRRIVDGEILSFLVISALDNDLASVILMIEAPLDSSRTVHITRNYEMTTMPLKKFAAYFSYPHMLRYSVNLARRFGMAVSLPAIFGNVGETVEFLGKTVNLLLELQPEEYRTIRPVIPYPGTPLHYLALQKGLLQSHEQFFQTSYNPNLMTVNFTDLNEKAYYEAFFQANSRLISAYHRCLDEQDLASFHSLYLSPGKDDFLPPVYG